MNEQDWAEPVRLYAPEFRDATLVFLRLIDHRFSRPCRATCAMEASRHISTTACRRAGPRVALRTGAADHRVSRLSVRTE